VILIALGSNRDGEWGSSSSVLVQAVGELNKFAGMRVLHTGKLYETVGVGPGQPEIFVNSVVALECHCGPDVLLRRLKMIERMAGPRSARRWGPRILDLDILDFRGIVRGWLKQDHLNHAAIRRQLIIPHPLLHLRPFVLAPLMDVAPQWRHPVFYRTARELWQRMRNERKGRVLKPL
jgi:2-amino-4-hydroxy-6-hydroxymethyldihydropteridine diphosphokinase